MRYDDTGRLMLRVLAWGLAASLIIDAVMTDLAYPESSAAFPLAVAGIVLGGLLFVTRDDDDGRGPHPDS